MHSLTPQIAPVATGVSPALRQAMDCWGALPEFLPVGIYSCDDRGGIVQFNRRAAELWGRSPRTGASGVRFCGACKAFGPDGAELDGDESPVAEVLRTGKPARDREVIIERPDGSRLTILANVDPLRDHAGGVVGAISCFQDTTALKREHQARLASEARSRDILEALPAAIYTTDADGKITFYNQAAVDLAGARPRLGEDEWCVTWRLFLPDGTPLPHDQCPMAVALKQGEAVRGVEAVAERPDGSLVPFLPFPTPLRDETGKLTGAVNMLVDISDRKRAEAQQELLINELNHRVKNTLATVQSIAGQTARGADTLDAFLGEFEGRLMALGKAHDLLTRHRWEGAALGDILAQELAPFDPDKSGSIRIEGPAVMLAPRPAMALAMAFHEMAANAVRHGSLSRPGGGVTVSWQVTGDATSGQALELSWIEAGGPPVELTRKQGFGHRLIERTIAGDLAGACELAVARSGLRWDFSIPLAGVAQ